MFLGYVSSRGTDLRDGTLFFLFGSAVMAEGVFRAWRARRARGPVSRADLLLRRVWPTKSLVGEPLLDPPPMKYWWALEGIVPFLIGLLFAAAGMYILLAGFGIGGPIYSNTPG